MCNKIYFNDTSKLWDEQFKDFAFVKYLHMQVVSYQTSYKTQVMALLMAETTTPSATGQRY
jgi:hypothetical protein